MTELKPFAFPAMLRCLAVTVLLANLVIGCDLILGGGGSSDPDAPAEPAFLDLPGDDLFPEGILADDNGDLFVTGFGNGAIIRITDGTNVGFFKSPGEDGLVQGVGLEIDERRDRLWVSNFNGGTFRSTLKVFDRTSGDLLATVVPEDDGQPHFFNEIAIDDEGRVYITDTAAPIIWTAAPDLSSVGPFVTDPLLENPNPDRPFGLNGLALTPDGQYLIASVMDRIVPGGGRLVRVDVATKEVTDIELTGNTDVLGGFGGSDGMFFEEEDGLLLMVNVTPPGAIPAIITADFNSDYTSAELVGRSTFDAVYNRPTASVIRGDRLWTVNSQLDHIIDDQNGALGTPPDLPFQLVNVSLQETLGR